MDEYFDRLAERLLEKNKHFSYDQARTWVELLWEDFEATYAKAGHNYQGKDYTERIVSEWIERHGETLHEFVAQNPKYKHILNQDKDDTLIH